MTAEEKIDLLCSEHMNGLTTVWAATKCLHDIKELLDVCVNEFIISMTTYNSFMDYYTMVAGDRIAAIMEDMDDES